MAIEKIKINYPFYVQTVWDLVASREDYSWQSAVSRLEVLNEKQYVVYSPKGRATTVTVVKEEECKHWEVDMENDNIKSHRTITFTAVDNRNAEWVRDPDEFNPLKDVTIFRVTEEMVAKKFYLKPFIKKYLRKSQGEYVRDLTKVMLYRRESKKREEEQAAKANK